MVVTPFLRPTTATRINALKRRGLATIALLQDPPVTITVVRRGADSVGGWVTVDTYDLISISLANRDPQESANNQAAVETATVGTFRVWAPTVTSLDIRQDDRFDWDGQTCVVTGVQPERSGAHEVGFRFLEGRPSS